MKPTFVWRLVVEIPEGVDWEHPPQAWLDFIGDQGLVGPEAPEPYFSWPTRRHFLSPAAAGRLADRLRSYGATVTVVRSLPVVFPEEA